MTSKKVLDFILHDLLAFVPDLRSQVMFGGYGLYSANCFFAIIAENNLYLKVAEENKPLFKKINSYPFTYKNHQGKGKSYAMSYYLLSEEYYENKELVSSLIYSSLRVAKNKK